MLAANNHQFYELSCGSVRFTIWFVGSVSNEQAGKSKACAENRQIDIKYFYLLCENYSWDSFLPLRAHLPSSRSLRGPYLSMTIPRGSVMAESRKEPTVNARFSISSCSLQISQPFILSGPSGTKGLISTPSPSSTLASLSSKMSEYSSDACVGRGWDRL